MEESTHFWDAHPSLGHIFVLPKSKFESSKQIYFFDRAANFKNNNLTYSLITVLLGPEL